MSARQPSLGLALVCIGLFKAAFGVTGSLSIIYFYEVQNEKLNISTDFRSNAANLAKHLHPPPFFPQNARSRCARSPGRVYHVPRSAYYSGSPSEPKLKITIYRKADQLSGTEEIYAT